MVYVRKPNGGIMKSVLYVIISVLSLSFTALANEEVKVPRIKTVSTFNHPVIAQTQPTLVSKKGSKLILKRNYIARWGTQRFEYGEIQFLCGKKSCEPMSERTVLAMFTSCKGLKKDGTPVCSGLLEADDSLIEQERQTGRPWYACEDYDQPCRNDRSGGPDDVIEYPDRHGPGDSEMPGNMPI